MLDLARGRLDDEAVTGAESVRHGCPHCSSWWLELEGRAAAIDSAVAEGLKSFSPQQRRPSRPWLVAAAAALVLAAGLVWQVVEQGPAGTPGVAEEPPGAVQAIFVDGMETGTLGSWTVENAQAPPPLFQDGLESGDLSSWSS
jgi:hypothetical protein